MSRLRQWQIQWVVQGHNFDDGHGYRKAFTEVTAIGTMLLHYMEYGHIFEYRVMHKGKEQYRFPGDLFAEVGA